MRWEKIKRQFIKDVKNHKLEIKLDNGVYRHLTFKRPDTFCYRFDLVTFPGHLAITGDMGSNVFNRLHDMFEFFKGGINFGYWSEKLVAEEPSHDECRGQKFDLKTFYSNLKEDIQNQLPEKSKIYTNKIYKEVLAQLDDVDSKNWHYALSKVEVEGLDFSYFEYDNTVFSYHFLWRCFAISWGIKKYEEMKNSCLQM